MLGVDVGGGVVAFVLIQFVDGRTEEAPLEIVVDRWRRWQPSMLVFTAMKYSTYGYYSPCERRM